MIWHKMNVVRDIGLLLMHKCKDEHTKFRLQKELKLASKIHNIIIAEAKESYMSKLAEKIA
jgi:hypothetical protein